MANLIESSVFEAGIYQLETTDPVLGGVSGIANLQGKQLANRTKWLKDKVDLMGFGATGATAYTGNVNSALSPGWYYVTTAATNKPTGTTQGFMHVLRYNSLDYTMQIFHSMDTDRAWSRIIYDGPSYGQWSEFAREATLQALNTELIGSVSAFGKNTPPTNWLKCNGAAVSRTSYDLLFDKIGTTFGAGNGSTTFNLPDLRGEFIRGWDDGRGVDSGRAFGSTQADDFESHTHAFAGNGVWIDNPGTWIANGGGSNINLTQLAATAATGGTETRPRNVAMLYCIKFK